MPLKGFRRVHGQHHVPTDNAAIESFNGRFREECLNVHWFASIDDAQRKIDAFRWDYNEHHPHRVSQVSQPSRIR
jgi:putative transposase